MFFECILIIVLLYSVTYIELVKKYVTKTDVVNNKLILILV